MSASQDFGVEVATVPISEPQVGHAGYVGFNPHTETLRKGWRYAHEKARPIACDITIDHDVAIPMRDGAKLYADIYRPADTFEKVPAILCWSPFGKKFNGVLSLGLMVPWDLGIPKGRLSGLEKFEAPDPADLVPRGYAVVSIDIRGTGDSDGLMAVLGSQEGEDGYDTIEALAKMSWCDGNVGLAGNSHLAIAQWFIASQRPPSLKAIAPWEGCGDLYREQFARGGIYSGQMYDSLIKKYLLQGRHGVENPLEMYKQQPIAKRYWNDKRPDMSKIQIPTYITGTWTNTMHGMGAIRGWLQVDTKDKWLRWHPWQEWYDIWGPDQSKTELLDFFDHFLKGKDNGWEKTPRVRMGVLRFGEEGQKEPQSFENIAEEDFPLPRTEYKKLYFRSDGTCSAEQPPEKAEILSYNSASADAVTFAFKFEKTTSLIGLPKAVVYMSCPDNDDMDVYVQIEKLDVDGQPMTNLNILQYKGPLGILRASYRAIDETKSMHPHWPFHPHEVEEKIPPGTVVRLDIGIWAMGIEYEAGESLRVRVQGRTPAIDNFGTLEYLINKGKHEVHVGGEHASHVILPFT
ncbi:hypothetical protein LTR53_010943 [Teratosphaeriaceae sp. CCFEE 6253]|nr:hypothetical protein LTR53_010943 [Teratosphaeriaceae sp. CCFEE 6253]